MNPISFAPNRVSFQQRNNKVKQPNNNLSQKINNKVIIGSAIASACLGIGVANVYNDYQTKLLMQDMLEEYKQDDTKSIKIEDLNKDKTPEIILEKDDGVQCVYDLKNNTVNYKVDDEMIEKIR